VVGVLGLFLQILLHQMVNKVSLWVRDSEQALRINSEGANTTYHPELKLSPKYSSIRKFRRSCNQRCSILFLLLHQVLFLSK